MTAAYAHQAPVQLDMLRTSHAPVQLMGHGLLLLQACRTTWATMQHLSAGPVTQSLSKYVLRPC
jgi:hypothetical protein